MYIDSKVISWFILGGGFCLYLWNIISSEFAYATIFMTGAILLWMFVGFTTNTFNQTEFAKVLSGAGFLLALSVFFLYGLEEMPYPAGAIVFHSDGIAKALGLGIAAFLPLLFGIEDVSSATSATSPKATQKQTVVVDDEDFELADNDDLTSGEWDI
jgi:hypothetical protein